MPNLPPPAQHEHGTRRAGAIANGTIPAPPTAYSVHNLHWHLPDHLSAFADLLPSVLPSALEVRSPRILPFLPKNHFHNQRYGPFSEDRNEPGRIATYEPPGREPIGTPTTHLEPPARVRYPTKRMTTAEIRKRVRSVLDYVGRVQSEEGRRKDRAKLLGIQVQSLLPHPTFLSEGDVSMDEGLGEKGEEVEGVRVPRTKRLSVTQCLADLKRELAAFQETMAQGAFASPLPPPIPKFSPRLLPTPTVTSDASMPSAEPVPSHEDAFAQVGGEDVDDVSCEGGGDIVLEQVPNGQWLLS